MDEATHETDEEQAETVYLRVGHMEADCIRHRHALFISKCFQVRVSPIVGQKNGLNKVVSAPLKWERILVDFRSKLKTTSSASSRVHAPHLDQGQKIVYRANTRAEFPPFARALSVLESKLDSKEL